MTKVKSIKTDDLIQYQNLTIHQLENRLNEINTLPSTPSNRQSTRTLKQALRDRQRLIKTKAMEFEQTNNHHLLVFDSTERFSKIAGNSVLFYTITIADRIHRRFNIKNDTDDYSVSENGVVSIRDLNKLEQQLSTINVFPDHERSTSELHFYKLPRAYTDKEIIKFRDRSLQDVARITSIILPKSPVPELYNLILELNRLIYYNSRRCSDPFARDFLLRQVANDANLILTSYLNFANARSSINSAYTQTQAVIFPQPGFEPTTANAHNLFNLLLHTRMLRNNMANVENLQLIHRRELCQILEKIVEIERIATREYNRQLQKDRQQAKLKG